MERPDKDQCVEKRVGRRDGKDLEEPERSQPQYDTTELEGERDNTSEQLGCPRRSSGGRRSSSNMNSLPVETGTL